MITPTGTGPNSVVARDVETLRQNLVELQNHKRNSGNWVNHASSLDQPFSDIKGMGRLSDFFVSGLWAYKDTSPRNILLMKLWYGTGYGIYGIGLDCKSYEIGLVPITCSDGTTRIAVSAVGF